MNIALLGYGKMGKMVEACALQRGHAIVTKLTKEQAWQPSLIKQADVCIDFSHPSCVIDNIRLGIQSGKNLVVGTTGWYGQLDVIKQQVKASKTGFIYAPNFSLGVNLFFKVVEEAARLMNHFPEYDVGILEEHHNQKADSPSGTAKAIAEELVKNIKRKKKLLHNDPEGKIDSDALHISSLRCGHIPGKHAVIFDSLADQITLTHEARSREGFALGAVTAAEWLRGKQGFFTIQDMLGG